MLNFIEIASAIQMCLQIGDIRSIIVDVPMRGEKTKTRITLPKEYDGLLLQLERIGNNYRGYLNPDAIKDTMWPCLLKSRSKQKLNDRLNYTPTAAAFNLTSHQTDSNQSTSNDDDDDASFPNKIHATLLRSKLRSIQSNDSPHGQ